MLFNFSFFDIHVYINWQYFIILFWGGGGGVGGGSEPAASCTFYSSPTPPCQWHLPPCAFSVQNIVQHCKMFLNFFQFLPPCKSHFPPFFLPPPYPSHPLFSWATAPPPLLLLYLSYNQNIPFGEMLKIFSDGIPNRMVKRVKGRILHSSHICTRIGYQLWQSLTWTTPGERLTTIWEKNWINNRKNAPNPQNN